MKNIFILLATILTLNGKAQDNDPNCGILIDGVIADSIQCWNFSDMSVVFPVKQEWSKYALVEVNLISVSLNPNTEGDGRLKRWIDLKPQDFKDGFLSQAKYGVWIRFKNKNRYEEKCCGKMADDKFFFALNLGYTGGMLARETPEYSDKPAFQIVIKGFYQVGTEEKWNGNAYVRMPKYGDQEILWKSNIVPTVRKYMSFKEQEKFFKKNKDKHSNIDIYDATTPCTISGKKFDQKIEQVNYKEDVLVVKKEPVKIEPPKEETKKEEPKKEPAKVQPKKTGK